jgi:hypothetical protein
MAATKPAAAVVTVVTAVIVSGPCSDFGIAAAAPAEPEEVLRA